MKILFLTRHAESAWAQSQLSDHDRPLNERGEHDARRMAVHLAANYPPPQRIVSSTALRAATTARILGQGIGYPLQDIQYRPDLYLADPGTLLATARVLGDDLDAAMLVAHNPGMTDAINLLCDAALESLPTCGVARIGFDAGNWRELSPGNGRLLSLDAPKGLAPR